MNRRLDLVNRMLQRVQEETKKELQRAPMINNVPKLNLKKVVRFEDQEETKAEPQQAPQNNLFLNIPKIAPVPAKQSSFVNDLEPELLAIIAKINQ